MPQSMPDGTARPRRDGATDSATRNVRAGEDTRTWYRSDRCVSIDGRWYFLTREGIDVGPYESREVAERDAERLIRLLATCDTDEEARLTIHQFGQRPVASASSSPPGATASSSRRRR